MGAAAKRIYLVSHAEQAARLVRAQNPAQAIAHVTKPVFKASVATPDELVYLATNGVKVEELATEEQES